jgi:hypothetical protein
LGALGVRVAKVAWIKGELGRPKVIAQTAYRILQRPEVRAVDSNGTQAGVSDGQAFQQRSLALLCPPPGTRGSEVRAGCSDEDTVDVCPHVLQQTNVAAVLEVDADHVVPGISVGL